MPFLIPLAVGAAATAGGAAATTGLIGAGGAITGAGLLTGGGLAASIYGGVSSGMAAKQQGKDARAMSEYNARVEENKAKQLTAKSIYDQQRQADLANRKKSSMLASIGGSGVDPSIGSPLLVQAKQAAEFDLENLMIGYEGQTDAGAARNQATLDKLQGSISESQGRSTAKARYIGTGSSLLTGLGTIYGK